jgi:hypothetical protein
MQAIVDEQGKAFVAAVAKGRGITPAQVRADYGDGAVFAAKAAKAAGLVDRIASFEDVLASFGVKASASGPRLVASTARGRRRAHPAASPPSSPTTASTAPSPYPDDLADARVGALGTLPTTLTTPAPQARSIPVSDQNTAAPGAAQPDATAILAAERQRVSDVLAIANEYNVDAKTAQLWASSGMTVGDASKEILAMRRAQTAAQPSISVGATREAQRPFETIAHQLQAVVRAGRNPSQTDPRLLEINAAAQGTSTGSSAEAGSSSSRTRAGHRGEDVGPGPDPVPRHRHADQRELLQGEHAQGGQPRERQPQRRDAGLLDRRGGHDHAEQADAPPGRDAAQQGGAAWYATEETLEDAPAIASEVDRLVPEELTFQVEDKIYNGTGAGVPTGASTPPRSSRWRSRRRRRSRTRRSSTRSTS